ncbi:MAG: ABC transporter permease [Gemmataceae bacterium]|nr:ABC transporter permease [Gemmataceae bacterium]
MPGMGLETSLVEATYQLMLLLIILVICAVFAGILTLPIFYGALGYKVIWFWAADSSGNRGFSKILSSFCRVFPPAFSIFATLVSLGYFGAFDWPGRLVGTVKGYKPGPTQSAVKEIFDGFTRRIGEKAAPSLTQDVQIDWARCPDKAQELVDLWDEEQAPPPDPFKAIFPAYQNPPLEPTGPPPVPTAVIAKVAEYIAAAQNGSLYEGANRSTVDKSVLRAADNYFDRAGKESKAAKEKQISAIRAIILYVFLILGPIPLMVFITAFLLGRRGVVLGMRNIIRALLRTSLTYLAVFVLVFVLCCIWSILSFIGAITKQNDSNLKGIVTEKHQIPSQMKPSHLSTVKALIAELPPGERPENIEDNIMTWAFVGGSLDPAKRTPQNSIFFFATEPEKLTKMMPGLEDLNGEERSQIDRAVVEMAKNKTAVVIGAERLRQMGKRIGDHFKMTSMNYKNLVFDFVIVAEFPLGSRWDTSAVMNRKYLEDELDAYAGRTGSPHPLSEKCMNLIWVRLPNPKAFETLQAKINDPGKFSPAVKMEIESSAYANFLSPYKTLFWFMKYPLSIGLLAITTLVASLVIGIGVRERKTEIAVLKVLGFRPWMVLGLVLGEALLVGMLSGFMATATAYSVVNALGGISMGIAFFNRFYVPDDALWWGPVVGGTSALIGSILPSISAYSIKASQVFSRVT